MFVQVIRGQVRHAEPIYVELDQWMKENARDAQGWLGSAAGVTRDKRFIGLSLWESQDAAREHSARPEQDHWWRAFSELFVDPPTFDESSDVMVDVTGELDHAGFVQVMLGRGTDADRARALMAEHRAQWAALRPEILGTLVCQYPDGAYAMWAFFTSQEQARAGERREVPPELQAQMEELNSLSVGAPDFLDLPEPWVHSRSWSG